MTTTLVNLTAPIRTKSMNAQGNWRTTASIAKRQRKSIASYLSTAGWQNRFSALKTLQLGGTVRVTLTRLSPRELDSHDNLRSSFKAIADGVTDWLGLKNDRNERLVWEYAQERGPFGVRVRIVSEMPERADDDG